LVAGGLTGTALGEVLGLVGGVLWGGLDGLVVALLVGIGKGGTLGTDFAPLGLADFWGEGGSLVGGVMPGGKPGGNCVGLPPGDCNPGGSGLSSSWKFSEGGSS
jgi:hypothetical protein